MNGLFERQKYKTEENKCGGIYMTNAGSVHGLL